MDFLEELEEHQKPGGLVSRFFFFTSDNLLFGKPELEKILDGIISRKLKVNFVAHIPIDIADDMALLKKMRHAGATHFLIGLETLDIRNLEYIGKHITGKIQERAISLEEYYREKIKIIQNHGISIHGAFILGLPFDYFESPDRHTGIEIADFCIKNRISLQPCSLTDLPGSSNFEESHRKRTYLYGKKGSFEYLQALCLADLTETNRVPPDSLHRSSLVVAKIAYDAVRGACSKKNSLKNAFFMFKKSWIHPTSRGRTSLKERFIDAVFSFVSQIIASLYLEHGEALAYSRRGTRGSFERLYDMEKNETIRNLLKDHTRQFICNYVHTGSTQEAKPNADSNIN